MNIVIVEGTLSSDPRVKELPSGSTLYQYEVSTRDDDTTRSVPVVWLDPARPPRLTSGSAVTVVGAVRRRFFRAGGAVASRTEVDAVVVAKIGSARAESARRAAVDAVAGPASPRVTS